MVTLFFFTLLNHSIFLRALKYSYCYIFWAVLRLYCATGLRLFPSQAA